MSNIEYDICISGGLGHVGLPLGILLARAGKKVVLYDLDQQAAATVSQGRMPFKEVGAQEILQQVLGKTLFVSLSPAVITASRFLIVVIGTPVDEHLNPKFAILKNFFSEIIALLDQQHIVLRSTVFPGTTAKIADYLRKRGKKTRISFCPERIAEGHAIDELTTLPQIVSAFDEETAQEAAALFSLVNEKIIYLDPIEAELAKLFTNAWRYIHFAVANQFYQIATQHDVDFYKIYQAITHHYPRTKNFARAGFAAGPCLLKDTMQLGTFHNHNFFLGHAAMLVNEGMPDFLVQCLKEKYCLQNKKVGILGMAFKADNDDKRESLSYKLKKILEIEAQEVICSDVYIQDPCFVGATELVDFANIVILAAPHSEYRRLEIPKDKILVDIWNFYGQGGLF